MEINNYINNGATNRGTRVVEKNKNLDKNSFFKILSAQLMNQDPSNPADSTEFVAQLAQFTTLEEMENLNKTTAFASGNDVVGKMAAFDSYNYKGEQYGGIIKSIRQTNGGPLAVVDVVENGKVEEKEFKVSDISNIFDRPNPYLTNINVNVDFMGVSNMIGKNIKASDGTAVYEGKVKTAYKAADGVKAIIDATGRIESGAMEKKESFNETNVYLSGVYNEEKDIKFMLKYVVESEVGSYKYKVVEDGQNADDVEWSTYEADTEVRGIKMLLPKEAPELPCSWEADIKAFEADEKHVYSTNILEVEGE